MNSSKSETLEKIEQLLKCPICNSRYTTPKILPCFHTFCEQCIGQLSHSKRALVCPTCGSETPPNGHISTNGLILSILDILAGKDGNAHKHCDLCDEDSPDPAVSKCVECSKILCEHHVLNHKKTKDTKNHTLVPLESKSSIQSRERELRKVKREMLMNEEEANSDSDETTERPTVKEGPSYSEMIIQGLRYLGGRGTSAQIAEYISQHYAEVLKYKTKTWRNSVMGCLSVKSHLFSKEPMEGRPDKYIWVLKETEGNSRSKRPQKKRAKPSSPSEPTVEQPPPPVEEDEQALAGLLALEDTSAQNSASANAASPVPSTAPSTPPAPSSPGEEREKVNVDLITQVLGDLGGSATTEQIAETIMSKHKDLVPSYSRRKLAYTINAILSAPKYRGRFGKEKLEGQTTSIWKLSVVKEEDSDPGHSTKADDKMES